jgi:hypothetical protein
MPGRWPRLQRRRLEIAIAFHPLTPPQRFILSLIHLAFCCAGGIALVLICMLLRQSPLLAALGLCLMASYAYAYILVPARRHWDESEARYNLRVARCGSRALSATRRRPSTLGTTLLPERQGLP